MPKYNIVTDDGDASSVTFFPDGGKPLVATKEHPNFAAIVAGISGATDEPTLVGLFDTAIALTGKFNKVSDRVSIRSGKVYFDSQPVESVLTEAIIRFHSAGSDDFMALVNFFEKIEQNPNPNSKENLFRWLKSAKFSITPDGDIIGYKRVVRDRGLSTQDECYKSTASGPAIVDGEPHLTGQVPNRPGVIVEMARNEVTFDPHQTCSHGLHVADWSYANNGPMGGTDTLMVLVNPRDVVSVPVDYHDHKMRVCRYKVLKKVTSEETAMLHVDSALQTLTARLPEWKPAPAAPIKKSSTPRKAIKKAAAIVKKAAGKKAAGPIKKAAPAPAKKAPVVKAAPKQTTTTKALPKYYEEFSQADFQKLSFAKLQWLAKQWEIKIKGARTAAAHELALAKEAKKRYAKATSTKTKTKVS